MLALAARSRLTRPPFAPDNVVLALARHLVTCDCPSRYPTSAAPEARFGRPSKRAAAGARDAAAA